MPSVSRLTIALTIGGAALCTAPAAVAAPDSAMPGDDALTCQQIYAAGMAESRRDQDERNAKNRQGGSPVEMWLGAIATNGGSVVERNRRLTDAATAPPNPRLEHLKQLYAARHCGSPAEATGTRPVDESMTCEQIAMELQPYARQIAPSVQALAQSNQQLLEQGQARSEKRRAEEAAINSMAAAGVVDPTGASRQAYMAAVLAQQAKEKAENEAFQNSALAQQNRVQSAQLAAQGEQLRANERVQHLMQLAQRKHCDKR